MRIKGLIFVFVQFICIVILLWRTNSFEHLDQILIQCSAIGIGLWAIWVGRNSKFNIVPEVADGSILIKNGPYRYIRHPMYAAIILFFLPTIWHFPSLEVFLIYGTLLLCLILKLRYEENLLEVKFSDYTDFKKGTFRLLPFIY